MLLIYAQPNYKSNEHQFHVYVPCIVPANIMFIMAVPHAIISLKMLQLYPKTYRFIVDMQ